MKILKSTSTRILLICFLLLEISSDHIIDKEVIDVYINHQITTFSEYDTILQTTDRYEVRLCEKADFNRTVYERNFYEILDNQKSKQFGYWYCIDDPMNTLKPTEQKKV